MQKTLIGIGGVSRAGKSTFARLLASELEDKGKVVKIIHQDDWVHEEDSLPKIRNKADWETPKSILWDELKKEVEHALKQNDIVILEGLFTFYDHGLVQKMNLKLFIKISKELFKYRKKEDLRWGSKPEPNWYIEHIWSAYRNLGIPNLSEEYTILDGSKFFDIGAVAQQLL